MQRSLLSCAAVFVLACSADEAPLEQTDQADHGIVSSCTAATQVLDSSGNAGGVEPIELEAHVENEGEPSERTVFSNDFEKSGYLLAATLRTTNPDLVDARFKDLGTNVESGAIGGFGRDLPPNDGLFFGWYTSRVKDGGQEYFSLTCCRGVAGECIADERVLRLPDRL